MKNALSYVLLIICFSVPPANAAIEPITLELPVNSALIPYSDVLFLTPAYAALAFQNSGTPISLSRPMKIISATALQIGSEKIVFDDKKGRVYRYTASIGLPLGKEITVPVEIDTSNLAGGKLKIRIYSIVGGLVPRELVIKLESKMQYLANPGMQKNLINYLSARTKGSGAESKSHLLEQIAWDAINQSNLSTSGLGCDDIGGAESLSSQWALIIAIIIWCIGLPTFLFIIRRQRLKNSQL